MKQTPFNQPWRFVQVMLHLTWIFIVLGVAGIGLAVWGTNHAGKDSGVAAIGILMAALFLPSAIAMIISALATWPASRRTERAFDEYRAGKCLLDWEYPEAFWSDYVGKDAKRTALAAWIIIGCVGAMGIFIDSVIFFSGNSENSGRIKAVVIVSLIVLAICGVTYFWSNEARRRRRARLLKYAHAFIGPTFAYSGGDFAFWGSQMRGLLGGTIVDGTPPVIALTIGLSQGARGVAAVADVVGAATLRPMGTRNYSSTIRIPVPPGQEIAAADAVLKILEGRA